MLVGGRNSAAMRRECSLFDIARTSSARSFPTNARSSVLAAAAAAACRSSATTTAAAAALCRTLRQPPRTTNKRLRSRSARMHQPAVRVLVDGLLSDRPEAFSPTLGRSWTQPMPLHLSNHPFPCCLGTRLLQRPCTHARTHALARPPQSVRQSPGGVIPKTDCPSYTSVILESRCVRANAAVQVRSSSVGTVDTAISSASIGSPCSSFQFTSGASCRIHSSTPRVPVGPLRVRA